MAKMKNLSLDAICSAIADGKTMTAIAKHHSISCGNLSEWLEATPERSARARAARILSARLWDERAEQVVIDADDPLGFQKARELAHHYRWRAAKIAPRDYGEWRHIEHGGEIGIGERLQRAEAALERDEQR